MYHLMRIMYAQPPSIAESTLIPIIMSSRLLPEIFPSEPDIPKTSWFAKGSNSSVYMSAIEVFCGIAMGSPRPRVPRPPELPGIAIAPLRFPSPRCVVCFGAACGVGCHSPGRLSCPLYISHSGCFLRYLPRKEATSRQGEQQRQTGASLGDPLGPMGRLGEQRGEGHVLMEVFLRRCRVPGDPASAKNPNQRPRGSVRRKKKKSVAIPWGGKHERETTATLWLESQLAG